MEENPQVVANYPGVPPETYHKLGGKTLMMFVIQRIQAALVLLIVAIVLWVIQSQSFLAQIPISNLNQYIGLAADACFLLFAFFFLIAFFIAWLIYINYKFSLGEDSLKIKRGILNKEEVAIPYRQIQDVDIDRNLSLRMLGVSRILILTAGQTEVKPGDDEDESEGILPALDRDLAEWLQAELLKRANIQKVIDVGK
jgi:uncharacterized membrane protein YdbT with pleckstrin-like domain